MRPKRKIMIALPAYNGTTRVETTGCILQASREAYANGWDFDFKMTVGDSILPNARNRFIAKALHDPEVTDLLFLDHDIAWTEGAFTRIMSHPVDFVAGVYPKRELPITFPCRFLDDQDIVRDPQTGLIEVDGVPAGFMRLTRRCMQSMCEYYWHLKYENKEAPNQTAWCLFFMPLEGGRMWGEDFEFCRKWRAMGGKVWVDPDLHFSHIGSWGFQGSLKGWLDWETEQKRKAAEAQQAAENVKPMVRVKAGAG